MTANGVSSPCLAIHKLLYSLSPWFLFLPLRYPHQPTDHYQGAGGQIGKPITSASFPVLPAHPWTVEEAPTLSGGGLQYPTHDLIAGS